MSLWAKSGTLSYLAEQELTEAEKALIHRASVNLEQDDITFILFIEKLEASSYQVLEIKN